MREIKFRGKHQNRWLYGSLLKNIDDDKFYITVSMDQFYQVKEETIGQFTGLKDKNGVEIYEGDIIRTYAIQGYGKKEKKVEVISKVIFYLGDRHSVDGDIINETPKFSTRQLNKQDWREVPWSMFYQCEVIGNIYENKELLGE